jgi:hypothetical protein
MASETEQETKQDLTTTYQEFLNEQESSKKDKAGRELIRAIFGGYAIAEDSVI